MSIQQPPSLDELPSYSHVNPTSSSPTLRAQKYPLSRGDASPWLTLTLVSPAALTTKSSLPVYVDGLPVGGSVKLDLTKEDAIEAVHVTVSGFVTRTDMYALERIPFVTVSQTVWDRSMGDPRAPSSGPYQGKLSGSLEWPFSIELPRKAWISLKDKGLETPKEYTLPPAFQSKISFKWAVAYEVKVKVERRFFRPNDAMPVAVGYVPVVKPGIASPLRQLAYREASPELVGPDDDPEGWAGCDPVALKGTLFGEREVEVVTKLWMAKPLSYPRGSVIPLFLALVSSDEQALDVLGAPSSPAVDLVVHLDFESKKIAGRDKYSDDSYHHRKITWASARWWVPAGDQKKVAGKRALHGELHLAPDLVPSFVFSSLSVSYQVVMYDFEATGFKPRSSGRSSSTTEGGLTELVAQTVEVGTVWPDGPRPRSFTPPAYGPPKRQVGLNGFYPWGGGKPYEE
ncbi:hypothetical protein PUNSTDRAFT_54853 [Punctularia strigosozonata HHB-11173 SS5]|uniref:uncharacterized protein n=1 Tax=Punctularia strigosozonata (strain HHB-11173) TaxID=741275 RepID=UPI0004418611|nr:uncharacterized protein PUNSTDRAFT_54853 [Punctularia strigosozonata HHB-11173 SS5]EIN05455.1 hypothetical protein PUNSTDRAFT_54853 [Punctularia strigosozonata HHB-11173 SS5]